jgi:membrane protein insertase Oxa1/YidC/SpoIIIJ
MLNKEIPSFSKFKSSISKAKIGDEYLDSYERVTANLTEQKDAYNGYFVLIVISIGGMILQQFLSMRANKDANELSTVDGSQNQMNKTMMIMMPIIYGVFAFLYSASFSLYMITNTFYSIITTLIINRVMDGWFKKKLIEEEQVAIAGKGSVVKTNSTKTINKTKKK